MPVLMMDVAKRAGVSVTTVSHVMNQTREIAPDTRLRVLEAIKHLHYYKNTSARLLVRGKSDLVGLIISNIENPFFPPLIKSFERACAAAGLELLLGMTNYEPRKAEAAVRRMIESRVRGVAIMTSQIESRLIDILVQADVPVVALDLAKPGKGKSSLSIDYSTGIAEAVDHLYTHRHRRVAVIQGPSNTVSAARYSQLLRSLILEYGMTLVDVAEAGTLPEDGAQAAAALLQTRRPPTAILCSNDLTAIGAMGAAGSLGIAIPHELSIIGSDDITMARYSHPALSTVRIPRDAMGHEAFRLLEDLCGLRAKRGAQVCFATSFIARGSSGQLSKVSGHRASSKRASSKNESGVIAVDNRFALKIVGKQRDRLHRSKAG